MGITERYLTMSSKRKDELQSLLCLDKPATLSKRSLTAPPPSAERCGLRRLCLDKLSTSFVQESRERKKQSFCSAGAVNGCFFCLGDYSPVVCDKPCFRFYHTKRHFSGRSFFGLSMPHRNTGSVCRHTGPGIRSVLRQKPK